jgi:hypothetical protein
MNVTGKLINGSSSTYTPDQMSSYATRISDAITSYYSSASSDNFKVNVTVNITPESDENSLTPTDHAFRIADDGKLPDSNNPGGFRPEGVIGHTPMGENVVYLANSILGGTPATSGANAGTGKTEAGEPTLERTAAHELGHSASIVTSNGGSTHPAPGTMPGNLMNQTAQPDAGTKVTKDQILEMKKNYDDGKLNHGKQEIK